MADTVSLVASLDIVTLSPRLLVFPLTLILSWRYFSKEATSKTLSATGWAQSMTNLVTCFLLDLTYEKIVTTISRWRWFLWKRRERWITAQKKSHQMERVIPPRSKTKQKTKFIIKNKIKKNYLAQAHRELSASDSSNIPLFYPSAWGKIRLRFPKIRAIMRSWTRRLILIFDRNFVFTANILLNIKLKLFNRVE